MFELKIWYNYDIYKEGVKMDNKKLEEINREIEEELLDDKNYVEKTKKKGYLSIQFWIFFIILIMIVGKVIAHII